MCYSLPIFTKFCVQIPCGRGSVLLWRRCDMLCKITSGLIDNVTFGRNGRDAETSSCSDGHERRGDTGAESDVYECLFYLHFCILSHIVIFVLFARCL